MVIRCEIGETQLSSFEHLQGKVIAGEFEVLLVISHHEQYDTMSSELGSLAYLWAVQGLGVWVKPKLFY